MRRIRGSVAGRLAGAFAVQVLLIVIVGGAGLAALRGASERADLLTRRLTPSVEANARALQLMVDAETAVRGYQLTANPEFLAPYHRGEGEIGATFSDVRRLSRDPRIDALVMVEEQAADEWLSGFGAPTVRAADPAAVDGPSAVRAKEAFDRFRSANLEVDAALRADRQQVRDRIATLRTAGTFGLAALTVLAVLVAALSATRTVRWLHGPTARLREVVERLRMGETTARADSTAGPVEVRRVAEAVNTFADESDRLRSLQDEGARLRRAASEAASAIRMELEPAACARAAVAALGDALHVDHVAFQGVQGHGDDAELGTELVHWAADRADEQGARDGLAQRPGVDLRTLRRLWALAEVQAGLGSPDGAQDGATVLAPVPGADDVLGVVTLVEHRPRTFSPQELSLVQTVCSDLGRALEQATLFEQQMQLVDRLRELDAQKSDFLSTVSHELRTPLTSIAGYAELIRDGDAGPVTEQMDRMLEIVERNTVRLRVLIEDLLTLSRIEAGTLRSVTADIEVDQFVRAAQAAVQPQADQAGVRLEVPPVDERLVVHGDDMQLERVLLNLLSNAVKFSPKGSVVTLTAARAGDEVELRCTDHGIGIPAAEQRHLFGRFFRASNATEHAIPGTGLGLVIVKGIVERHDGRLELTSQEGRGTTVTVRLPLVGAGTADGTPTFSPEVPPLAH